VFAVSQGHLDVVKALIKRGANVNLATKPVDLQKMQATDRTAAGVRRQVLNAMVPAGGQPTASQQQAAIQAQREYYATGKTPPQPAGGRGR
jgi:ankyrin repeat protein